MPRGPITLIHLALGDVFLYIIYHSYLIEISV